MVSLFAALFLSIGQFAPTEASWLQFSDAPMPEAVEDGRELASQDPFAPMDRFFGDGVERRDVRDVPGTYRRSIGRWSTGTEKISVEWCTWLSPEMLSRWLGFLEEREHWPAGRLQERWDLVTRDLRGRLVFMVELAAYPKRKTLGFGNYERPDPETIRQVRFLVTADGFQAEPSVVSFVEWEAKRRDEVEAYRWWYQLGFGRALAPEFDNSQVARPLPLGDYHKAWYVLVVDQPPVPVDKFEVRVLSAEKERIAHFDKRMFGFD